MEKPTWRLSLLILIVLSFAAAGCGYSQMVKTERLNVPSVSSSHPVKSKLRVYAVRFKAFDSIIETKIFGLQPAEDGRVRVIHGLSSEANFNEISDVPIWELEAILKRYHYDSLKQFIDAYKSKPPIIPNSEFKALPDGLGKELYDFVQKYDYNHFEDRSIEL